MNTLSNSELLKLTDGFNTEWDKNFIHFNITFRDVINAPRNDFFAYKDRQYLRRPIRKHHRVWCLREHHTQKSLLIAVFLCTDKAGWESFRSTSYLRGKSDQNATRRSPIGLQTGRHQFVVNSFKWSKSFKNLIKEWLATGKSLRVISKKSRNDWPSKKNGWGQY